MKRILTLILILIAFALSAIKFTVPQKGFVTSGNTTGIFRQQTDNSQQAIYFDLAHSLTSGQEILHNVHNFQFQQVSTRVFHSSFNAFRLKKLKQQIHLQYLAGRIISIRKAAICQLNGYYLYQLRKLLI